MPAALFFNPRKRKKELVLCFLKAEKAVWGAQAAGKEAEALHLLAGKSLYTF